MLNRFRASALAVVLGLTCATSALAAGGPFKVGYLDIDKVKQNYPDAQRAEMLKLQSESQLREIVARANEELQKASQKKETTPADLEKIKHDMQLQINGMQEAYRSIVGTQTAETNNKIAVVTNAIAKEKGLDMVVDRNNVFGGADKLVGCEDVTDAVLSKLVPSKPASPAAKP